MNMNVSGSSRRAAAFAVAGWIATKEFPQRFLPQGEDRAFVQDLVYTTIRRLRPLRRVLGEYVKKWPKGELEALLYVGAAQLLYMDAVPDFAAVSETVEAAKKCGNPSIAKVVNGVLRNVIRNRESVEALLKAAPLEERESYPTALVKRWTERYGAENAEKLCRYHNAPAVTHLARKDGSFVELERGVKVESVEGFEAGEFIVQDPGTALAVGLVDAKPGEKILDACAAPGGKTIQLAWRGAEVTACEINPARRARLEENLKRVKLEPKVVSELPSAIADGAELFDKVLVDAPCSNTGVLRRRPDARWNWSMEKVGKLAALQAQILDVCAPLVRQGGTLVYSTCSNEPEENEQQIAAFLERHPEFEKDEAKESVPFESGNDGAFACSLIRSRNRAAR